MSSAIPVVTVYPITVFANTVQIGDVLRIGGTSRSIRDMRFLSRGAKRLILDDGGVYILGNGEPLLIFRPVRSGPLSGQAVDGAMDDRARSGMGIRCVTGSRSPASSSSTAVRPSS